MRRFSLTKKHIWDKIKSRDLFPNYTGKRNVGFWSAAQIALAEWCGAAFAFSEQKRSELHGRRE
jgi:hypothetical protein